jgi:hypothetical protein
MHSLSQSWAQQHLQHGGDQAHSTARRQHSTGGRTLTPGHLMCIQDESALKLARHQDDSAQARWRQQGKPWGSTSTNSGARSS